MPNSHKNRDMDPSISQLTAEEEKNRTTVLQKIDQWKKRLIDLTKRNKLLYFSPSKSTIKITKPPLFELLNKVVVEGKPLSFPMLKKERQPLLLGEETDLSNQDEKTDNVRPGDIETNISVRELQSRLNRLSREWKTWQEEQGVHTLFMVLGVLHWQESDYEKSKYLAPLILIPVGLVKDGGDKPYKMEFVEEDIVANPALAYKLKNDFNVELPDLPEDLTEESLEEYFKQIEKKVMTLGWPVSRDAWIGRFSFEKYVMYKDLENFQAEAWQHPVIKALASAGTFLQPSDLPPLDQLDEALNPEEVFPVLDADSSQTEVLVRARAGQHLVVYGPPGTGKSQTIVNLIAQTLRDGKRVLFVSEKMAALEVVYRRLRETGIAIGCLEVHSHHKNKGSVIEELGQALQHGLSTHVNGEASERFKLMIRRRGALNKYVRELHVPRGQMKLSAFKVHGKLSKLLKVPDLISTLPWQSIVDISSESLERVTDTVNRAARASDVINNFKTHPWIGANLDLGRYSLQYRDSILTSVKTMLQITETLQQYAKSAGTALGLPPPETIEQIKEISVLIQVLIQPIINVSEWLDLQGDDIAERLQLISEAEVHSRSLLRLSEKISRDCTPGILELQVASLLTKFKGEYKPILTRWLKGNYWQDKALVLKVSKQKKLTYEQVVNLLSDVVEITKHREWIKVNDAQLRQKFGAFFNVEHTEWSSLREGFEWIKKLQKALPSGKPTHEIRECVKNPDYIRPYFVQAVSATSGLLNESRQIRETLGSLLPESSEKGISIDRTPFPILSSWLKPKIDAKQLDSWATFLQASIECTQEGLKDFLEAALRSGVKAEQFLPVFLKQIWKAWLAEIYAHSLILREFQGSRHEDCIKEFRNLDRELKKVAAKAACAAIEARQPQRTGAQSTESQVGILLREMQKKRRHKSLRRLFTEIPHLLQGLKPCFLMSPLSVASYLTKDAFTFDLVIFDEASQIPPADAIGAVLRGKQLIVAGDDKQLPPTRFFQADLDDYQEEEKDVEPLESILNECKALPGFIESSLSWHYRSRFEELITFSNRYFYRSQLVTFPSPHPAGESGAIRFVHVPDGLYDRGGSRTNRVEAKRVVDLIAEHFKKHGQQFSLGVITLSFAQEEAVLEEWEKRKSNNPQLAALASEEGDEPLFIKALEKVQGDERDFIIISVGYGKDDKGVLHLNFGPINQFGGERRLNVAVTRARSQTTTVASFLPHELDLARLTTQNGGVIKLQQYLEYAKNCGKFPEIASSEGAVELNDFEESIKQALELRGLKVDGQVGSSGYRIDLAIRHPEYSSRYILAVECDGATYHSHRTARDRDRLREEVLIALGWKIHRIWSTDWIKEPEEAINQVLLRFEELHKKGIVGVEVPRKSRSGVSSPKNAARENSPQNQEKTTSYNFEAHRLTEPPFPIYKPYCPAQKRESDSFYKAKSRVGNRVTLMSDVVEIVQAESPIHPKLLAQRIGDLYNFARVGSKIEAIVGRIVELATREKKITKKNGFLWTGDGIQSVQARVNDPTMMPRNIEYVASEELGSVIEWLLQNEYGLPKDALIKRTAQVMGYDRTGENVRDGIEKSIDMLLKQGRITAYDDQFILTHKQS